MVKGYALIVGQGEYEDYFETIKGIYLDRNKAIEKQQELIAKEREEEEANRKAYYEDKIDYWYEPCTIMLREVEVFE